MSTMVSERMATFFVPLMLVRLYETFGAVSPTETVTTARPVPPGPVAMMMSLCKENVTVGLPEMRPLLVFNVTPREVRHVVVNGRVVIEDRRLITADERRELQRASKACRDLFTRAGLPGPVRLD